MTSFTLHNHWKLSFSLEWYYNEGHLTFRIAIKVGEKLHLFYIIDVVHNSIFKLGATSRKNKIIAILFNPVLILLKLNKLRVGNIVKPDLANMREFNVMRIEVA